MVAREGERGERTGCDGSFQRGEGTSFNERGELWADLWVPFHLEVGAEGFAGVRRL